MQSLAQRMNAALTPAMALSIAASACLTAQTWTQLNPANSPSPRNAPAVFDSARGRAILFAGYDGNNTTPLNDTWEWDGSNWNQLSPTTTPPGRWTHSMAYDSARQRTVLFGGFSPNAPGVGALNDTWEFDGTDWIQRTPTTVPPARISYSLTYDKARGRTVLFGGYVFPSTYLADTWEWDGNNWTQVVTATAPSPRQRLMMAYDEIRQEIVAYGGGNGVQLFGDTWTYNGSNWTQRAPATSPPTRWGSSIAYDGSCGGVLLFGGADAQFMLNYNDLWRWDGSNWAQVPSNAPSIRHGMALVYDDQSYSMLGFAGRNANSFLPETWTLDTGCGRTMSEAVAPLLGRAAVFEYNYPPSAAGRLCWHFVTAPFPGALTLPIPGFTSIGQTRVNVASIYLDSIGILDGSGVNSLVVGIPNDPTFLGVDFDVQSLDIQFGQNLIYWARNDVETEIGPLGPPAAFNMALVGSGSFQMGSAAVGGASAPVHQVTISRPFWIGKYEVSQAEYQALMGNNPSAFQSPNQPVDTVTYAQAEAYCAALQSQESAAGRVPPGYQYRLPTEAEWEFACRAGSTTEWNVGASIACAEANIAIDLLTRCVGSTAAVGSYAPNALGLHDMHGNVSEWVLDRWDGTANYPSNAVTDPYVSAGPLNILRGGAWNQTAANCRSATRSTFLPGFANSSMGFRVSLAPVLQ